MKNYIIGTVAFFTLVGCVPPGEIVRPELPSLAYTRGLHQGRFGAAGMDHAAAQGAVSPQAGMQQQFMTQQVQPVNQLAPMAQQVSQQQAAPVVRDAYSTDPKASYRFVKDLPPEERDQFAGDAIGGAPAMADDSMQNAMVSNMMAPPVNYQPQQPQLPAPTYSVSRNSNPNIRPYQGPLHLGDPGASASLWRTQGQGSRLFRDHRAFQPMDLVTIVVSENAQGTKEADTETSKESSFLAGITEFFNFTDSIEASNPGLDTATLLDADFNSEFTGEGETTRSGSLQARIAAVVVEVLPNGVMRVEGEKIISVNNEEQVIVISGLVRPKDVNSLNEVQSSQIAYLRVDYFGKGMLGDVQYVGWVGRLVNTLWPF